VAFTINTNVASLQAQYYLNQTLTFQNQTINEVTSGDRIVNSGDDPSGLAIANSYRSNEAVLTQGIANANEGVNQLQIADGGISNISQLLDSARTLATESASDTFTGDRGVLNNQFQSVLTEINRQAQSIGLNQGGTFAKALNVFIGGGEASGNITATQNGTVSVNLSNSTVDAKSLGLEGVTATGINTAGTTDIGPGSQYTSVQDIVTNGTNLASVTNNTTNFVVTGPGFTNADGSDKVDVAVNLAGVTDTDTLVAAVNQAIQNAGNGTSQQSTAFKNANITASITTNAAGQQTLAFSSPTTAFQIQGGDQVATALLGNFGGSNSPVGSVANVTAAAGSAFAAPAAAESIQIRIQGSGLNGAPANDLTVALTAADTVTTAVAKINAQIALTPAVAATGVTAVNNAGTIGFVNSAGNSFSVQTAGDVSNALGFGSWTNSTGLAATAGTFNYTSLTAVGAGSATTENLQVSINGGAATVDLGPLTGSATETTNIATLNTAFQGNATTRAAGIEAIDNGGNVEITSSAGDNFRLNFYGGTGDAFGFGAAAVGGVVSTAGSTSNYVTQDSINSAGAQQSVNAGNTDVYKFTPITDPTVTQTVTLAAVDANGTQHTLNVALNSTNAGNLDQAVNTINSAILASNDSTLQQIGTFKEENTAGSAEGIRFLDAGGSFNVSLGATPTNSGIADGQTGNTGGTILASAAYGTGSTANISNVASAGAAVTALGNAVTALGNAQAQVGIGENDFTYAVNLAQSQLTNFQAAEAQIRDSDLALESANLTKSQIQLQAGVAALSQANSAPQQVLALLQHP
jgi:flagellin